MCDWIDNWRGPKFKQTGLKYGKTPKTRTDVSNITELTCVMNFNNYRKRCMNSQEDHFKDLGSIFFAQCIQSIMRVGTICSQLLLF